MSRKPTVPRPGPRRAKRWVSPLALPILRMDWRASSQPVGWVERSETHHPATRTPPRKAMGFAFGSTHPTDCLQPVGWVERSETHHPAPHAPPRTDRKSDVEVKGGSVRVDLVGRRYV